MDNSTVTDRIVRGLKATLVGNVLSMLSKGLLLLALTRFLLTPDEFGLLFFAISVLAVANLFATLGIAKSTAKYVSEFVATDRTQLRHILRVGLAYNLLTILLVSVALVGFRGQIADVLDEPALLPFLLAGPGYVAFKSLNVYLRSVFQGFNQTRWSALVSATSSLGQLVLVVGYVLLDFGTIGAFLGYVTAYAVAAFVGFAVLYGRFYARLPHAESVESDLRGRILRYNFPLASTKGAGVITGHVDKILVGFFLTPAAVGFYTLGRQISEFVMTPATALGFVVSPTFGSQKASGDLDSAARIYETSFENILLLYIPAAAGIVLVAEPTIRLVFGQDYIGAVPVVQVLAVFTVVKSIDKITNDGLDYLGKARIRAIVKGIGAIVNFVLNVLFIPVLGVVGAAVATVISITGVVLTNVYLIHLELDLSVGRLARNAGRTVAMTSVMTASVWVLVPMISGLATLAGVIAAGALVYLVLALAGGLIDVEQVRRFVGNYR